MRHRRFFLCVLIFLFQLGMVLSVAAQEATPEPDQPISFLFVQTATGGSVTANDDGTFTLTLEGVGPTVWFSDRPERLAGHLATAEFVDAWGEGADTFADDPPNAAFEVSDAVHILELLDVAYDESTNVLTYSVQHLDDWDGSPSSLEAGAFSEMMFEAAALFFDDFECMAVCKLPVNAPT